MFLKEKKVLTEEELKQKKLDLDASLLKAEKAKKKFLDQRVAKIKEHTAKVELQRKEIAGDVTLLESFRNLCEFWKELHNLTTLNEFQTFMQKSETVSKASILVSFIEIHCFKESFEFVKARSKVFMSLALLANYPDEVIPNASREEQDLLSDSKFFYERLGRLFDDSLDYSALLHKEISCLWITAIHKFDEWLLKDKISLFDKLMLDFMTWTKTIGSQSIKSESWAEWEPHSIRYQNEIIKRIHEIFGKAHVDLIEKSVKEVNETFVDAELFIEFDSKQNIYCCIWRKKVIESQETPENNLFQSSLPEKVKSTNIRILHELMLKENINFESVLEMSGKSLSEISESNRAGISKLISILGNQSDTTTIARSMQEMFRTIVSMLNDLAGDNEDYCEEIRLIDPTVDPSTWISDSSSLLHWILSMCQRCCAPARDQNCNELELCIETISDAETPQKLISAFVNIFTVLFDLLNLMRSDFCNFRMKFLVSQIEGKNIAENYELEEFTKKFASSITKTEKWLKEKQKEGSKPIEILADSFMGLLDPSEEEISESNVPETFYLDIDRIQRLRMDLVVSLVREAGLIYVKNHLRMYDGKIDEAEKLTAELNNCAQNSTNLSEIKELFGKCIQNLKKDPNNLLNNNINRLFRCPVDDKVFILLKNREIFKLRTLLISTQKDQPGTIAEKAYSLFNYNKICYSTIYDKIILKK